MKFSLARLLIATTLVAVWLTVSLHVYGYCDETIFPRELKAAFGGALICGCVVIGVCGVWDLSGMIEQKFRGEGAGDD